MKTSSPPRSAVAESRSPGANDSLAEAEIKIIDLFAGFVQVLGFPKSYGQIYGYLFAQNDAKTMEQIIRSLGISLGSASQGLKALRAIGAVHAQFLPGTRRDAFVAELELKKLLGGFIREQLLPQLLDEKLHLQDLEKSIPDVASGEHRAALQQRLRKLKDWQKKIRRLLPILEMALTKF